MTIQKLLLIAILLLPALAVSAEKRTFSIMSYNVENLFDTQHDEGKEDWTYLPLAFKNKSAEVQKYCATVSNYTWKDQCFNLDWSTTVLNKKIKNISKVIRSYDNGRGPDIVVVQEVENYNVLKKLRDVGLRGMGYKSIVLIEGPDKRGIDVGILSRFTLQEKKLHPVHIGFETRGILQATFTINRKRVVILGNHWPSQGAPDSARYKVAQIFHKISKKLNKYPLIAVGDFNTLDNDIPHGINELLLNQSQNPYFEDAQEQSSDVNFEGSNWYQGRWSYLDKILIMNPNTTKLDPIWNSFAVNVPSFVLTDKGGEPVPYRFDYDTSKGYSDHLGVTLKLKI